MYIIALFSPKNIFSLNKSMNLKKTLSVIIVSILKRNDKINKITVII